MVSSCRRVVLYCGHAQRKEKGCIYATFPKDVDQCRSWLQRVGVEDLVYLPHQKLNTIRFVCGCHFTDEQFSNETRKRLKRSAIPSLIDARVVPLSDSLMEEFHLTKSTKECEIPSSMIPSDTPQTEVPLAGSQPMITASQVEPSDNNNKIEDPEPTCSGLSQITKRYRPSDQLQEAPVNHLREKWSGKRICRPKMIDRDANFCLPGKKVLLVMNRNSKTIKNDAVIGGGAIEMELSRTFRDYSHKIAHALEIIPRQLCDEADFDVKSILNKLR